MNPYSNKISKITSFNTVKLGLSLGVACALGFSSANANSEEATAIQVSASQVNGAVSQARLLDAPASADNETQVAALHQQATLLSATATHSKVTREQRMALHQKAAATQANQKLRALAQQNQVIYYDFSFYDAQTRLFEDFDYDGFYQTFSVTFDADINSSGGDVQADVFAELYLSQNGGPWIHYYSTDVFTLNADSSFDDYEVLTTLTNGYQTDHYDVLVDLYELGYADPVATISSDDVDSLYALPLESGDRDTVYVEEVYVEEVHGGALSWLTVSLFGALAWRRRLMNKK
ncbi:GlyGly-CTERM sorting domain-containing protein [Shewanella algicola]|uniref:Choice-of-anchor H family protein n=1 Tax=Shewanella algicola TaxID=640633 RepID=A0A9X2CC50_9GAMM|nr:choice-of-anchor H family protein [Shewanella algicola]MCL1103916.1 choice-of-anchor H family protein [Shewanella algicola]GGP39115.1 GlyGly-CTERM sorting domain-containing protein [Shewanella algicola]